jgi:hypothetical protein
MAATAAAVHNLIDMRQSSEGGLDARTDAGSTLRREPERHMKNAWSKTHRQWLGSATQDNRFATALRPIRDASVTALRRSWRQPDNGVSAQ